MHNPDSIRGARSEVGSCLIIGFQSLTSSPRVNDEAFGFIAHTAKSKSVACSIKRFRK
jgi:hypothetical protein